MSQDAQRPVPDDHHWLLTQKNIDDISDLKEGQGRLESGMEGLQSQVRRGFDNINNTMLQNNKPKPPFNWPAMVAGVIAAVTMLGGVLSFMFLLITNNMQRENDLRFTSLRASIGEEAAHRREASMALLGRMEIDDQRELKDAYDQGRHDASLKEMDRRLIHDDELGHIRDERLNTLEKQAAAALVSRKAIGDYLQESRTVIDRHLRLHAKNPVSDLHGG